MLKLAGGLWVSQELSGLKMKDERLARRMKQMLKRASENPESSLPGQMVTGAELMAAYRFFNNERVTCEAILGPHREAAVRRGDGHRQLVVIQDTTELEFTGRQVAGSGILSWAGRQGFLAHVSLVVTAGQLPLGVIGAEYWTRHGGRAQSNARKREPFADKESARWQRGYELACELQSRHSASEVVSIADREADIYECLAAATAGPEAGPRAKLLTRANRDRVLLDEAGHPLSDSLFATAARAPLLGSYTLQLPRTPKRPARQAEVELRGITVLLRPPYRPEGKLPPVRLQVVAAVESAPPEGSEPIAWYLLTTLSATSFEEAREVVCLYTCRWAIELFFRTLKTGCRIEQRQLTTRTALERALTFYFIVAWRLEYVKQLARVTPDLPCTACFADAEWQALCQVQTGQPPPPAPPTMASFIVLLAKAGGYLARRHDPPPGTQHLWQGIVKLAHVTEAWLLFQQIHQKCV